MRIHDSTVSRHISDYMNDKLKSSSGGSTSMLNESQTTELIDHLTQHLYQTTQEIIDYVFDKYDVKYSVPGIGPFY